MKTFNSFKEMIEAMVEKPRSDLPPLPPAPEEKKSLMDILYLGDREPCVEAETLIAAKFPSMKFELDYDYIHEHRLVVKDEDADRALERAYIKFMLQEGYGRISFLIQMYTMDKDGAAILRPILDELKAEKAAKENEQK